MAVEEQEIKGEWMIHMIRMTGTAFPRIITNETISSSTLLVLPFFSNLLFLKVLNL